MTGSKSMPKDVQAMCSILTNFNVAEYDSCVLNQMLEFTYRYVTTIIEDAVLYSTHANRNSVGVDDVKLAITLQQEKNFASPPPRELTAELARTRNVAPLSQIKSSAGLRVPQDRNCLTTSNYQFKSTKKMRTGHTITRVNVPNSGIQRNMPKSSMPCPIKLSEGNKISIQAPNTSVTPAVGVLFSDGKSSMGSLKRPHEDDDYDNN